MPDQTQGHTPGDYEVRYGYQTISLWAVSGKPKDATLIAELDLRDEASDENYATNFKLLAQAPALLRQNAELVKALQGIASFSDSQDDIKHIMAFRWQAVKEARAALAKHKEPG